MPTGVKDYNPFLPSEAKDEIIEQNFEAIRKDQSKKAYNQLAQVISKATQVVSSVSFVDVTALTAAIVCSGGAVKIECDVSGVTSGAINASFQLVIDGNTDQPKDMAAMGSAGGALTARVALKHEESMLPGPHKIQVQAKVDGGSVSVSSASVWSRLLVKETIV